MYVFINFLSLNELSLSSFVHTYSPRLSNHFTVRMDARLFIHPFLTSDSYLFLPMNTRLGLYLPPVSTPVFPDTPKALYSTIVLFDLYG